MDAITILLWLLIGGLAGLIAGEITKGSGFGVLGNIVIGIIGAILGGWMFGLLGLDADSWLGSLITATVGSVVLLFILGLFGRSPVKT